MKKIFHLVIALLVSALLVACDNGTAKDWKSTQYEPVNDFQGVSMTVKVGSVSPTEVTVILANKSDEQGVYSEDFLLEKEIKEAWYQVPTIIDDYGFNDIGYELPSSETDKFIIDWKWLYGSLEPGNYRVIKKMLNFRGTGDFDEHYLAAPFTID